MVCSPAPTSRKASAAPALSDPERPVGVAGQDQQREGHDRQPAELQQRAHPDKGHAAPAQVGTIMIRAKADQRAQRREHQRQGDHQANQPCGHEQFHDHDPIQCAVEQYHGHAHRHLEQREAQQPPQRQFAARRIREGHPLRAQLRPEAGNFVVDGLHEISRPRDDSTRPAGTKPSIAIDTRRRPDYFWRDATTVAGDYPRAFEAGHVVRADVGIRLRRRFLRLVAD